MTSIKLIRGCLPNISKFHSRCFLKIGAGESGYIGSVNGLLRRQATTKAEEEEEVTKFSGSKAAKWKSRHTFGKKDPEDVRPKIEGNVLLSCMAIMLIYFCVLREENDLDEELRKDLTDRVPGLKAKHEIHLQTMATVEEEMKLRKK